MPAEHAIRGFHGVTLLLDIAAKTAAILTDVLASRKGREGTVIRFGARRVTAVSSTSTRQGLSARTSGGGSVHHIAFRAADDAEQGQMAEKLVSNHGLHPTEQRDRNYFRSVYFREPGGVLFEIATDIPGFAVDEPVATLGRDLKLPGFLEAHRKQIEDVLPSLEESVS